MLMLKVIIRQGEIEDNLLHYIISILFLLSFLKGKYHGRKNERKNGSI